MRENYAQKSLTHHLPFGIAHRYWLVYQNALYLYLRFRLLNGILPNLSVNGVSPEAAGQQTTKAESNIANHLSTVDAAYQL